MILLLQGYSKEIAACICLECYARYIQVESIVTTKYLKRLRGEFWVENGRRKKREEEDTESLESRVDCEFDALQEYPLRDDRISQLQPLHVLCFVFVSSPFML